MMMDMVITPDDSDDDNNNDYNHDGNSDDDNDDDDDDDDDGYDKTMTTVSINKCKENLKRVLCFELVKPTVPSFWLKK